MQLKFFSIFLVFSLASCAGIELPTKITKPMGKCVMDRDCSEENMKIVREYFGTYEGTFNGDSSGRILMEISDYGKITGYIISHGQEFSITGQSTFSNKVFENHLYINAHSSEMKFYFTGKLKDDGLFNTTWGRPTKTGIQTLGSLSMHKTAPYKKKEVATTTATPTKTKERAVPHPTKTKQSDNTKLFEAAKSGDTHKIRKLVHKGYDLDAVDQDGATPFCVALKHGHVSASQDLMAFGSNKKHKDHKGRTPLHYAAIYNVEVIAGALIYGGVDASVKDKSGKTARDWAVEKNNSGVVRILDALVK